MRHAGEDGCIAGPGGRGNRIIAGRRSSADTRIGGDAGISTDTGTSKKSRASAATTGIG